MKHKEEQIESIAKTIKDHRVLETKKLTRTDKNLAVALSKVHYMGENRKIWLTGKENLGGFQTRKDITGATTSSFLGDQTTLTEDGNVVYKNSRFGEILIRNFSGKHSVPTPAGDKEIEIYNLTTYSPHKHQSEAYDLTFSLDGEKPNRYKSLSDILQRITEIDFQIQHLEESQENFKTDDSEELLRISQNIEEEKQKRELLLNEAQSFIRKNAELRHQPILDRFQEEIKRSGIFNGTIAIDGGPGTGKTTSLIQRIKFLTDREAMLGHKNSKGENEAIGYLDKFSKSQLESLFGKDKNWVFFTPNELLKLFLRNSMISEGLKADNSRVLIWKDYLINLVKQYKLVNPETQNPFLFLRKYTGVDLLPHDSKALRKILSSFKLLLVDGIQGKLKKTSAIDVTNFRWKNKALSIQRYIGKEYKNHNLEDLIRLFFNLQESYEPEVKHLTTEFNESLKKAAARLILLLKSNQEFKAKAYVFSVDWQENSGSIDELEDELEDTELEENSGDQEAFLFGKFKVLIKNLALSKYDSSVSISKKYIELHEIIKPYADVKEFEEFNEIGQLAYFSKYFVQSTRGIVRNIIAEIPKVYKAFRRKELAEKQNDWNYELLNHLVVEDKSKKRIHPDEQALLIYFINSIIRLSYKVSKPKSASINHAYFQAFHQESIPVIGVDEATDFHLIDLLAIHSLGDLEISSVTFSGDIMQRLTSKGIRQWEDLGPFIKNLSIKPLQVSYRQSPTLLKVAKSIYEHATNRKAKYNSFADKDPKEPKPLLFKTDHEEKKIDWIAKRILEIYQAYGKSIPSIAIFLSSDDQQIDIFTQKLAEIDELADNGILVRASKDGQVLGDGNTVRVFPIEFIKGLEFEAVFFHNLHQLNNHCQNQEMILKNLYVGLSRASFYMGVTSDEETLEFEFLESLFEKKNLSWKLDTSQKLR